jgi:orotidine-5'-phosphate decarboxylase
MAFRTLTANLEPHERIICAYDRSTLNHVDRQDVINLMPHIGMFKIGKQAMAARILDVRGESSSTIALQLLDMLDRVKESAFYDDKLKDIKNTVVEAIKAMLVWPQPPKITTIHATTRVENIIAALEATRDKKTLVAGVTLLTDHELKDAKDIYGRTPDQVILDCAARLAQAVEVTGVNAGIVCAPAELPLLERFGMLVKITPNIRDKDAPRDDQNKDRSMTAAEAIEAGADYLVIGRPIMKATQPVIAAQAIAKQIEGVL